MYALVTTHRGVITQVVTGPDVDTLKGHVARTLNIPLNGTLKWDNYMSHWGLVSDTGLTVHTIHQTQEVS